MSSVYDIGRTIQLPATKTTVELDPTQLTKRLRSAIARNLRRGIGYGRGAAAQISSLLASKYGIAFTTEYEPSISRPRVLQLSQDDREALRLLIIQDYAEFCLDNEYAHRNTYYQSQYQRHLDICAGTNDDGYVIRFLLRRSKTTALNKFIDTAENNAECVRTQQIIDALNGNEPILLKVYHDGY